MGERYGESLTPDQQALIVENSDEVPESSQALVERLCYSYSTLGFLHFLIDSGKISAEEFEHAWNTFSGEVGSEE